MKSKKRFILEKISRYIDKYTYMKIGNVVVNCPYWANKLKDGKVKVRGFLNGKGEADDIQEELNSRLGNIASSSTFNSEYIQKFAKRERIGIDCSGFVFRVLDMLVKLQFGKCRLSSISDLFMRNIDKMSASRLTDKKYAVLQDKVAGFQLGDLIRMTGGKHIAVILEKKNNKIIYFHSSRRSKVQGVHQGIIDILDESKSLEHQYWLEEAKTGENFGDKYFKPLDGDGVFRLKIFIS